MNLMSLLLLQAFSTPAAVDGEFPRLSDPEPAQEAQKKGPYPWIGVEAAIPWTSFDGALRIENTLGFGVDGTITLDFGKKAFLGFRVGYRGWSTQTDDDVPGSDAVEVRQYRIGVFSEFSVRMLELGVGANTGAYHFRREGDNDTTAFFDLEGRIGVRPHPQFWAGVVAIQSWTVTDFNRGSQHSILNYSIGPAVEFRF